MKLLLAGILFIAGVEAMQQQREEIAIKIRQFEELRNSGSLPQETIFMFNRLIKSLQIYELHLEALLNLNHEDLVDAALKQSGKYRFISQEVQMHKNAVVEMNKFIGEALKFVHETAACAALSKGQ